MPLLTIDDLKNDPGEVEDLIARAMLLSQEYESYLQEDGDGHLRLPGIHASEASGCRRQLVYGIMGTPRVDSISNDWRKKFKVGHAIHEMLQADFEALSKRSGFAIQFEREVKIKPGLQPLATKWNIQSSCDGVFTIRDGWNGPAIVRVGLEIKSAAPRSWDELKGPLDYHEVQTTIYQACLDLPLMWTLYWNKGNENYTPSHNPRYFTRFNHALWAKLEAKFEIAHQEAAMGQLPDREESLKCQFCPFAHTCQPASIARRNGARAHDNPRFGVR